MKQIVHVMMIAAVALGTSACWDKLDPKGVNGDREIPMKARGEEYLNLVGTSLEALDAEGKKDHGGEAGEKTPEKGAE
ncbi:MAG: hypothetical protein ACE366_29450 [Bradymonadia bacterium]